MNPNPTPDPVHLALDALAEDLLADIRKHIPIIKQVAGWALTRDEGLTAAVFALQRALLIYLHRDKHVDPAGAALIINACLLEVAGVPVLITCTDAPSICPNHKGTLQ